MATLSIQVRLGLSRGWRVRSLIKAKFYAQSVVHCLFIFSFLRAKGLSDRIWTLHYGVFTNNTRYFIHVEYFRLPVTVLALRPLQEQYLVAYYRPRDMTKFASRASTGVFSVPHARKLKRFARVLRKNPGRIEKHEKLYWAWDRRSALAAYLFARVKVNRQLYTPEEGKEICLLGERIA